MALIHHPGGNQPESLLEQGCSQPLPLLPNRPMLPPASSLDLVEKQGLADVAPSCWASSSREQGRKQAMRSKTPAGADEEHHGRQADATPSKQVCQEKRLKVGLGADREGRALKSAQGGPKITSSPLLPPQISQESVPSLPAAFPPSSRCPSHHLPPLLHLPLGTQAAPLTGSWEQRPIQAPGRTSPRRRRPPSRRR